MKLSRKRSFSGPKDSQNRVVRQLHKGSRDTSGVVFVAPVEGYLMRNRSRVWVWHFFVLSALSTIGCGQLPTVGDNGGVSLRQETATTGSESSGNSLAAKEQKKRDCLRLAAVDGGIKQRGAPGTEPIPPGQAPVTAPCDPGITPTGPVVPSNEPIPPCDGKIGCVPPGNVPPIVQTPPPVLPPKGPCAPGASKIGHRWGGGKFGGWGGHLGSPGPGTPPIGP